MENFSITYPLCRESINHVLTLACRSGAHHESLVCTDKNIHEKVILWEHLLLYLLFVWRRYWPCRHFRHIVNQQYSAVFIYLCLSTFREKQIASEWQVKQLIGHCCNEFLRQKTILVSIETTHTHLCRPISQIPQCICVKSRNAQ